MKIAEIKFFDTHDNKEHINIIELKSIKFCNIEDTTFSALSVINIYYDGELVKIEGEFSDQGQHHHKIYTGGLTIFSIVSDIINTRYFSFAGNYIIDCIKYFNTEVYFHSGNDWHE